VHQRMCDTLSQIWFDFFLFSEVQRDVTKRLMHDMNNWPLFMAFWFLASFETVVFADLNRVSEKGILGHVMGRSWSAALVSSLWIVGPIVRLNEWKRTVEV